jgi:hypothetical protein
MDLILVALFIAGIVWVVRNRQRLLKPAAELSTKQVTGIVTGLSSHTEIDINGTVKDRVGQDMDVAMRSSSVHHQKFFVRQENGVEKPVHLWGSDIPVAEGQRVTVIYSCAGEHEVPGYFFNHAARQGWQVFNPAYNAAVSLGIAPSTPMIFIRAFVAAVIVGILGWMTWRSIGPFLVILGMPVIFVVMVFRDRSRRRRLGRMMLEEYRKQERDLLAAPPPGQVPGAVAAGVAPATPA